MQVQARQLGPQLNAGSLSRQAKRSLRSHGSSLVAVPRWWRGTSTVCACRRHVRRDCRSLGPRHCEIATLGTSGNTGEVDVKHFLSLRDWGPARTMQTPDRADELARLWKARRMPQALGGKRVALWFYGNGFRNRLAFELGAKEMGASIAYMPGELGVHEPIEDVAGYLANWFEVLVLRAKRHEDLLQVAARSRIPVINARTDRSHPCEILGDLLYVRRRRGDLAGLKVVFVGEPSNLCMSWAEAGAVLPISVIQVCPPGREIPEAILKDIRLNASGEILVNHVWASPFAAKFPSVATSLTSCAPRPASS
jgi:hypothetical protein